MPKYDAFGREIGEHTLSGLGGEPSAEPQPVPTPVPAEGWGQSPPPEPQTSASFGPSTEVPIAPPAQPEPASFSLPGEIPAAGRPRRARRGIGGFGCLFALIFAGAILVGPIIAVISFVDDAADTFEDVRDDFEGATGELPGTRDDGSPAEDAPAPTGLAGRSMLRPANLRRAIALLEQEKGTPGRVILWPDRTNAELITRRDNQRNVVVTYEGELRKGEPVDVGIPQDTVGWDRIEPAVPSRFVKAAAKRFDLRPERIDYVIGEPDAFDDEPLRWIAYFKGGAIVQGDENGRVERRIS